MYEAVRQEDVNLVLANIGQHHVHLLERVGPSARSFRRFHPSASPPPHPPGTSRGVTPDARLPPPVAPSLAPRVACSSRPATGTSGAGSGCCYSGGAAGTRPTRSTSAGLGMGVTLAGQLEAAPGIVVSGHHQAPQTESAECTGSSSHD